MGDQTVGSQVQVARLSGSARRRSNGRSALNGRATTSKGKSVSNGGGTSNGRSASNGKRLVSVKSASASNGRSVSNGKSAPNGNKAPKVNGRLVGARRVRAVRRPGSGSPIGDIQRSRMLAAMASAVREVGISEVTVADVVSRSGVSRRTFYEMFTDREDCLSAALEESLRRASERVRAAYDTELSYPGAGSGRKSAAQATPGRAASGWRARVRAGLEAFLSFLDDEPTFGALLVVDSLAAGEEALARRAAVLSKVVDVIDEGCDVGRAAKGVSRITAEGLVGGVLAILHHRLLGQSKGKSKGRMIDLSGQLMGMITMPYLGAATAAREIELPARARASEEAGQGRDLLSELNTRLTYRTLLVLRAISAKPGASNRQVAEDAGVTDQGQVSKLLSRLADHGLIENGKRRREKGEANTWRLTRKGREVEEATRGQG